MGSVAGEISKQLGWLICGVKKKKKKSGNRYSIKIRYDFSHHNHFHKKP